MNLIQSLTHSWKNSKLNTLFSIELPLIQAPMAGGATTPELVAAVSNAGGLGSLGAGYMSPDEMKESIDKVRQLSDKPFSVNLFIPEEHSATQEQQAQMAEWINRACAELNVMVEPLDPPYAQPFDEQMEVVLDEKVPVFSFTFGIPDAYWIKCLKEKGIKIVGTATSLLEAKALEKTGIDAIIAQSSEAGGHRGTFMGNPTDSLIGGFSLIPQIADNANLPVIAAGGIMNAKGILAALILGADGVQMGTAFLTCTEAGIHPEYKNKLIKSEYDDTTLTTFFSGRLARGIHNKFIQSMSNSVESALDYPIQNTLTKIIRKAAAKQNNPEFMSLWAGQSAYLCEETSAEQLIVQLKNEINNLLVPTIM